MADNAEGMASFSVGGNRRWRIKPDFVAPNHIYQQNPGCPVLQHHHGLGIDVLSPIIVSWVAPVWPHLSQRCNRNVARASN